MNRLAKKINEARIAAGLTEKELAMKCGLSVSYLLQVETGKKIINESVAEKILKALGAKEKFIDEEKPVEKSVTKNEAPKLTKSIITEPTASWADALAGLIKKYPVYDLLNGEIVSFKELPIIHKKIYGYHPDKIMFVKSSNSEMTAFRIEKDDILTVYLTKEIQNGGIYLCEMDNRKIIRQIKREENKLILSQYANDSSAVIVDIKKINVIGRIVRNEFLIK